MISVTETQFDQAVEAALAEIPAEFRPYLENVVIEVAVRPGREASELDEPNDILGLYVGHPLEDQFAEGQGPLLPDRILIYRENLCAMCDSLDELIAEIRITVLHEIGHHFGLDEDALDELGYA